jgi:hypothetical protein
VWRLIQLPTVFHKPTSKLTQWQGMQQQLGSSRWTESEVDTISDGDVDRHQKVDRRTLTRQQFNLIWGEEQVFAGHSPFRSILVYSGLAKTQHPGASEEEE